VHFENLATYPTIKEIGERLNISHSTVSRALNGHSRVSEKTRNAVLKVAEEMGYPTKGARLPLKGQSRLIGVIVPDLTIHFFAQVVQGIQREAASHGYGVLIFDSQEQVDLEIEAVSQCIGFRVEGIVAAIAMNTRTYEHFEQLRKNEIPLVFYDRVVNFFRAPKVISDDYQAAFDATDFLIRSGCKHIAHITASINLNNSNNRLYGYMDALSAANMEVDESLIHYYEFETASIDAFVRRILKSETPVDGFFVFNDYVANYLINLLQKEGIKVPEEISVMGFSDEPVATSMTPQLSTMKQFGEKMGRLSAQKMISILNQEDAIVDEKIVIRPELVVRGSTSGFRDL
jgi:DNA-binding LacI/PurR family transcriptional regulator